MKKSGLHGLLVLALLAGTVLACSVFTVRLNSQPTQTPIPATPTERPVPTVLPTTSTPDLTAPSTTGTPGEIEIHLTDDQMTAYLAEQLKNQPDSILENPRVHAHDTVIDITGTLKRSFITSEIRVSLSPTVDDLGKPHLKIQSADLGGLPIPDTMLESFSNLIEQSMIENADPQQTGYTVKSIQVADGYIVLTVIPK